jgi:hypothetical protein
MPARVLKQPPPIAEAVFEHFLNLSRPSQGRNALADWRTLSGYCSPSLRCFPALFERCLDCRERSSCHAVANYDRFGNARAAASSLAFGAGGFARISKTRKLSRVESFIWPVLSSATARKSNAFSSARIRKDVGLLFSSDFLNMYTFKWYVKTGGEAPNSLKISKWFPLSGDSKNAAWKGGGRQDCLPPCPTERHSRNRTSARAGDDRRNRLSHQEIHMLMDTNRLKLGRRLPRCAVI